eukprot:sb/3469016/
MRAGTRYLGHVTGYQPTYSLNSHFTIARLSRKTHRNNILYTKNSIIETKLLKVLKVFLLCLSLPKKNNLIVKRPEFLPQFLSQFGVSLQNLLLPVGLGNTWKGVDGWVGVVRERGRERERERERERKREKERERERSTNLYNTKGGGGNGIREISTRRLGITQELTDTSIQPIRTRYLGQVTSYQPISDQHFLIPYLDTGSVQPSHRRTPAWNPSKQGNHCQPASRPIVQRSLEEPQPTGR